jgi:gamma-tubulin complex component 2
VSVQIRNLIQYFLQFMVEDNQVETDGVLSTEDCDGYWEKRYTIRKDRVPLFIAEHAEKILRTGKYLNVMQQCGKLFKKT